MLTHKMVDVRLSHTSMQQGIGWLLALLIIAGLVRMITSSPWFLKSTPESEETVAGIGRLLMIDYLLPFEIASVLLLAALIGAAMLARKEN